MSITAQHVTALVTTFASVALLAFLVGCASTSKVPAVSPLDGTAWQLVGWDVAGLDPADFEITLEIEGERVAGKAAVNRYFGPIEHDLDGTFQVGLIGSTMMAGPEPAMRAEQAFTRLLPEARRWGTVNDELRLFAANGTQIMALQRTN